MRSKFPIVLFTLLMLALGVSFVVTYHYLDQNNRIPSENVLGSATHRELSMKTDIEYIKKRKDGSTEVKYKYTLGNESTKDSIANLSSHCNLHETFKGQKYEVVSVDSNLKVNKKYNGSSEKELLAAGNKLKSKEKKTISLVVKFFPNKLRGPFENKVIAAGDVELATNSDTDNGSNTPAPTPNPIPDEDPKPVPPSSPDSPIDEVPVTPEDEPVIVEEAVEIVPVAAASNISFTIPEDLVVEETQVTPVTADPEVDITNSASISSNETISAAGVLPNTSGKSALIENIKIWLPRFLVQTQK